MNFIINVYFREVLSVLFVHSQATARSTWRHQTCAGCPSSTARSPTLRQTPTPAGTEPAASVGRAGPTRFPAGFQRFCPSRGAAAGAGELASRRPRFPRAPRCARSGALLRKGIWPFLPSPTHSCCAKTGEEEVFCAPGWCRPLVHSKEVNPKKLSTLWFFCFPPRFIFLTCFLLSGPLTPARTFLKVFRNNHDGRSRPLLLATSFVPNPEQLCAGSLVLPFKVAKLHRTG